MPRLLWGLCFMITALALSGCGSEGEPVCETNDDCVEGYLCVEGLCEQRDAVQITRLELPDATVELSYNEEMEADGGVEPYSWFLQQGPDWLTIDEQTGIFTGTSPAPLSGVVLVVEVRDSTTGRSSSDSAEYEIDVDVCVNEQLAVCYEPLDGKCMEGLKQCKDGQWGACEDLQFSISFEHCGPQCATCDEDTADACKRGVCVCGAGAACAGGDLCCDGDCINPLNDDANCGSCGNDCTTLINTIDPGCQEGACVHGGCIEGYLDCDSINDCETPVGPGHCGSCEVDCNENLQHVDEALCVADGAGGYECDYHGDGTIGEGCEFGFYDCDSDRTNGCETPVSDDNCSACGDVCQSQCLINPDGDHYYCGCDDQSDCGANGQCCEGFCFDIDDTEHCGSCSNDCTQVLQHTVDAVCNSGNCDYTACEESWLDCDADRSNGCETPFSDDDCGACGFACGQNAYCDQGACTCNENWGNCFGDWNDGCETDLLTTTDHCGDCDTDCYVEVQNAHGETCTEGLCNFASCEDSFGNCDSDRKNGCEENIWLTENCGTDCDTVDCNQQVMNAADKVCSQGHCDYGACITGFGDCDADYTNGCEENIWSTSNCGTNCDTVNCYHEVDYANDIECAYGTCDYGTCKDGHADCDSVRTNGCEIYLWDNHNCRDSCGAVPVDCNDIVENAVGPLCYNGSCSYLMCEDDYGDCDDDTTNGCETDLLSSNYNCGECHRVCEINDTTASNECIDGECNPVCSSYIIGDCDGDPTNGCEQILNVNEHCGACDNECGSSQQCFWNPPYEPYCG